MNKALFSWFSENLVDFIAVACCFAFPVTDCLPPVFLRSSSGSPPVLLRFFSGFASVLLWFGGPSSGSPPVWGPFLRFSSGSPPVFLRVLLWSAWGGVAPYPVCASLSWKQRKQTDMPPNIDIQRKTSEICQKHKKNSKRDEKRCTIGRMFTLSFLGAQRGPKPKIY